MVLMVLLFAMVAGCIQVCWGVAGVLSHGSMWQCRGCLPPVADPGPCAPPRDPSARVGLRGYRRFHANDSLVGRPVPCTRDDKICFRHNLIFDPEQDRCEPIGGGHHHNCDLRPNRTEFEHGSGRLIGVCKEYVDPCPGYRMAYDGRCYRKKIVRDFICGCGAKPTRHFLEGVECRGAPATPINIQQPLGRGRCVIPDLRFPDSERVRFFKNPFEDIQGFQSTQTGIGSDESEPRLRCSPKQAKCFSKGEVRVSGFRDCFNLLEQGPCPRNHVVAMDAQAASQGRAEATCVHVRGECPRGHKRMVFDGECHENREIKIEAPGDIKLNQFGKFILIPYRFNIHFTPSVVGNGVCEIKVSAVGGVYSIGLPQPPCGANDNNRCELFEVEVEPPKPFDDLDF